MQYNIAGLHIIGVPYRADCVYEYYIPHDLVDKIVRGSIVNVPFGRSNRKSYAVVYSQRSEDIDELQLKLKPIFSVDPDFTLSEELMGLCDFTKRHCFCSFGDVVKCIVPSAFFSKIQETYTALPFSDERQKVSVKALVVYDAVASAGVMSAESLIKKFGKEVTPILSGLVELGYLKKNVGASERNIKQVKYIHLLYDNDGAYELIKDKKLHGLKQIALVRYLIDHGSVTTTELSEVLSIGASTVKSLADKGIIEIESRELSRTPYKIGQASDDVELSNMQNEAYSEIESLIAEEKPNAALLYGITGSGKTMVIKKAIDKVLSIGKQVIMLVPEIALTPQAVAVFCSYYGDKVALLHSSLSDGERFDAWRKISSGEACICIGTRSAVFAPFDNLGMIVIDEEHEHTYKSESNPKYHARDIARYRCAHTNSLMLLCSATPSIDSFYKAEKGYYKLIKLTERYNNAKLPQTIISDMRIDAMQNNTSAVGSIMQDALKKTIANNDQAILFVNRRGYNNYISCPLCGFVQKCEKCSVSMTYHSYGKKSKGGYLVCHYCGNRKALPAVCPECANEHMNYMGFGTQKAEDDIATLFNDVPTIRMDADTASSRHSIDKMLEKFRKGEAKLLVGTQMVSKGHDFPGVTLVGVLLADASLYLDDYRANERTFSLITQVVGRAGRGDKAGIAIIQTYNPEHPVIKLAAAQNYEDFYKNEIAIRKNFVFPPFCDMVHFTFSSTEEAVFKNLLGDFAARLSALLKGDYKDVSLVVFGPFEAPVYRVNNTYRMKYIFKCRNSGRTRELLSLLYTEFSSFESNKLGISIDVNPN